jgi:hypothetical protein
MDVYKEDKKGEFNFVPGGRKMKFIKFLLFVSTLLLAMSLLVACGGGNATEAPAEESPQPNAAEPSSTDAEAPSSDSAVEPTEGEAPAGPSMPENVPIMEGFRDFQATSDFTNISYIVDLEIVDVVTWYQGELPNFGWELSRAPDSAMGSIANMSRINEAGDRLTISLQHNPVGEFTVVRIVIIVAP